MIGCREASAIRTIADKRKAAEAAASARANEAALPQQTAFARRISEEVLIPVLKELCEIATGAPGAPVFHAYHRRAFGVTCDLDSLRFSIDVFLLPDAGVRIAVSVIPSQAEGWHRDYSLSARNDEIEEWVGRALSKVYAAA
jgi:hypothetical protein